LWHLLAATGLRRGEALGLRWRDVNLTVGTVSIRQTVGSDKDEHGNRRTFIQPTVKSGRPHMIALDPGTVSVLRAHRSRQREQRQVLGPLWDDHDLVFCRDGAWLHTGRKGGGPLDGERVSSLFRELVDRTPGVSPIRLHDLRHTWATLALSAGVHPKVVQERLNHATISITLELYSHTTVGMDRAAADLVSSLFSSKRVAG
jgi:integrase